MMETLVIILGYRCNFKCAHCIVGGKTNKGLTSKEKELIASSAVRYGTKYALFVGGEPTLYIPDMNEIIPMFGGRTEFRMTTNGHFAVSKERAAAILASVPGLSGINLSYDSLHAKFLPEANIKNLYAACQDKGLDFNILFSLHSPMDLLLLKNLKRSGNFVIRLQKLLPAGSALSNNLGFKYPSFDEQVLSRCCPIKDKVIYMCGQGFTLCCSSLVFNTSGEKFVFPTVEELVSSDFYKLMTGSTFKEIRERFGLQELKMLPEHSEPCVLCEYLFRSKFGAAL